MSDATPEELTQPRFRAALHTTFLVESDDGVVELVLTEVTDNSSGSHSGRMENFSLIFHGPGDRLLRQCTYSLEHPVLGRFALFVVPVGREADGFLYQAIFSRRV